MAVEAKSWTRLAAEAFAIVLSILAAFAIDAWWDARQLRQDEAAALQNLRAQFAANVQVIEAAANHHRTSIEAGEELLAMARGDAPLAARPRLDTLLMVSFIDFVTYESNSSALNDLIDSGRLSLIQDDTLRSALAIWPTAVEDVVQDQQLIVRMVENALLPYLTQRVATVDLYRAGHAVFGPFEPSRSGQDLAALIREREFESHLANRMAHERQVLDELNRYLRPVAELILEHLREGAQ